jgi:hypothetical protein
MDPHRYGIAYVAEVGADLSPYSLAALERARSRQAERVERNRRAEVRARGTFDEPMAKQDLLLSERALTNLDAAIAARKETP